MENKTRLSGVLQAQLLGATALYTIIKLCCSVYYFNIATLERIQALPLWLGGLSYGILFSLCEILTYFSAFVLIVICAEVCASRETSFLQGVRHACAYGAVLAKFFVGFAAAFASAYYLLFAFTGIAVCWYYLLIGLCDFVLFFLPFVLVFERRTPIDALRQAVRVWRTVGARLLVLSGISCLRMLVVSVLVIGVLMLVQGPLALLFTDCEWITSGFGLLMDVGNAWYTLIISLIISLLVLLPPMPLGLYLLLLVPHCCGFVCSDWVPSMIAYAGTVILWMLVAQGAVLAQFWVTVTSWFSTPKKPTRKRVAT